jgi:hypothetical protein
MNRTAWFAILGLSVAALFSLVNCGGGSSPTEPNNNPKLVVAIAADCDNKTECVAVEIDGVSVASNLKPGQQISKEVTVGNHTIHATGACDTHREWGPFQVNVTSSGHTETLSCGSSSNATLTVTVSTNCYNVSSNIKIYIDDAYLGTFNYGQSCQELVSVGQHQIYAESSEGNKWGPVTRNVPAGGYTEILQCDTSSTGLLSMRVVYTGIPCASCFSVTDVPCDFYYTEVNSNNWIYAGQAPTIGANMKVTVLAKVGNHKVKAEATCGSAKYYSPVYEVYLPPNGTLYTFDCSVLEKK